MRIRFVSRMLAVVGFFAAAAAADAQSGTVVGSVTETGGGAAIGSARIEVATGATLVASGTTGADGNYRIANVPVGTYSVKISRIGYGAVTRPNIAVTAGGSVTVNASLGVLANVLTQVVTTGTRGAAPEKILESPNAISLVSSEAIAQRPSATVTDHLKSTPGLSISSGGIVQANIVSRGFNNAFSGSMLMLQDYRFAGVPSLRVNVPFLFTGASEDIDRIEVLQGPASALYGPNSGAGVLHVITKSPFQSEGTTLTLDGGERSMVRLAGRHAGVFGGRKFGYKLSGEYFQASDWEYNDPNEPAIYSSTDTRIPVSRRGQAVGSCSPTSPAGQCDIVGPRRDFGLSKYSMEGRLDWRPNEDTEAITTFGYTMAGSALEITTTFGAAQVQNWSYTNFQQRFRHKQFFAQVFYNQSNAGNDNASDDQGTYYLRTGIPVVDKSSVLVGQMQQGFQLGATRFTGGLDVIQTTPVTEGTINGRNEEDDNISEMGAYLQVTHPLSAKIDFLGAARVDMNSRIEGEQFSPRAAILYKMSPTQNFRFTFNRAFNSPASFAFALDQFSGQRANLGPAISPPGGTEVRIFGNPSKRGWDYDRSCTGTQTDAGGLCMRSNFTGGGPTPVAGSSIFPATMAALAGQLAGGIGLPPTQTANIANALRALTPTNAQIPLLLRNVLAGNTVAPFSGVQDFDPLGANFSNTWEIGYKGVIGNRLSLSADYWFQIRPAEPTTQVINGDDIVFFNPTSLGAYLGNPATGITSTLVANGVPAGAVNTVLTNWVTTLAGLPTGALNFDNPIYDKTYLVFSYQNAKGQVDVRGLDLAADYTINGMWEVSATYSQISRNVFADAVGATVANPLTANTPKYRASLSFRRNDMARGMNMEIRGRYADAMTVNSGVFNSYNVGTPTRYPNIPVNAFLDLGFSWKLPVAQNVRWSLNVQNVLDNRVQSFVGVAPVGRYGTTRVSYTF